jgi:hypothetical protein
MASFHSLYRLPYELRHDIWECHRPSGSDSSASDLIKATGAHIYGLPRDRFWDRTPDIPKKIEFSIQKEGPSPYQALAGCSVSGVVALKQIKKLLEADPNFGGWLKRIQVSIRQAQQSDLDAGRDKRGIGLQMSEDHRWNERWFFSCKLFGVLGIHASGAEKC